MKRLLVLSIAIIALLAQAQNKPYITKVYDFMPAPGQFVNNTPLYEAGEPLDSIMARASRAICGYTTITTDEIEMPDGSIITVNDTTITAKPGMISLGSFGGYVVFGFDHPVVNVEGEYDLQIFGNGFQANNTTTSGGSSEPGIVMVSRDVNGNGVPDDPWYELAGSEYNNPKTQKHFTITYYKPDDSQFGPLGNGQFYDQYIRWTCNSVDSLQEGYIRKNSFHNQSYWPQWVEGETLTFEGTKLPCNAVDQSGVGNYWVQSFYDWGYVDNRSDEHYGYGTNASNIAPENLNKGFKIDWAVDDDGNPKVLKKIDFVKVYCAMLQDCGWIGEESTEVCGAVDLHPDAVPMPEPGDVDGDGNVTAADITSLYNYLLNGDETYLSTSDVDGDGVITSADITFIYNILLGNN
ncbi:MAG: dockerin type I repeat-containing protein [Muribaculaceae bacterium]|nr:dockerin type I repeat-containing protein [Muribaculaceae bacterium]